MAMTWKPFGVSRSSGDPLPPLLLSTDFTADGYKVYVTDLVDIWGECLDRRAIIRRSQDEGSSIDPSDRDQMKIFLEKIKLAIGGEKGTTSALAFSKGAGRPTVTIHITVKLPGGLAPLEWQITLAVLPHTMLASQLTAPLLGAQYELLKEVTSLVDVINDKDHVIQKLVDRLEEQNTQLGQIFPQAAGRGGRKVDRTQAEGKVKGLGPFDIVTWRNNLDIDQSQDGAQLVEKVFGSNGSEGLKLPDVTFNSPEKHDWWEKLKGKRIDLSTESSAEGAQIRQKTPSKLALKAEDTMEEDDFQVQAAPPRVTSATTSRQGSKPIENSCSEDDDDLNGPSQCSKILDSFPRSPAAAPSPKQEKLGTLGGKKKTAPKPPVNDDARDDEAPSPAAPPLKQTKVGRTGGKNAAKYPPSVDEQSTTDDEAPAPSKQSFQAQNNYPQNNDDTTDDDAISASPIPKKIPSRHLHSPQAKKKGGIGRIGGKKDPPPPPKESIPPLVEPAKPKRKLGTIGGKRKEVAPSSTEPPSLSETTPAKKKIEAVATPEAEARGRSVKSEKLDTPPRETSEERADKRRQQLKRDLEAKAKVSVKKRRKF